MRLSVIAVGRWRRDAPEAALFADYAGRLPWSVELIEVAERRKLPLAELKAAEAALIEKRLPPRAVVVALDGSGKALSSEALAKKLRTWVEAGEIACVIGGAEGLDRSILERAETIWSLGPATWPHMLVRPMLAEQMYRAHSILTGHPYHRG
ncbi:MAG: 23S rRNA (pseudouridine(1915)-N(3))-methyltransferase RlmH [Alphaproteobacteria bacterium]